MEYQVYKSSDNLDATLIDKLRDIKYLHLQEIEGEVHCIYVPKDKELKEQVIKDIRAIDIGVSPESYVNREGKTCYLYLKEQEIQKHLYKAKKKRRVNIGDIVYLKEYKDLPFQIIDISGTDIKIEHRLKYLNLTLDVSYDMLETRKINTPFYKSRVEVEPIAKIFLDCDIFLEGDCVKTLFSEMWVLKTILPHREIIVMNPLPDQEELLKHLGIRVYKGWKKSIIYQKVYDKDLDLIYSNNLTYLHKVKELIILEDRENIKVPKKIYAKDVQLIDPYGYEDKNFVGKLSNKVSYDKLDYMNVRDYLKKKGLKNYLGDLPYYIKMIKT
jgi:hypothetical protein